MTNKACSFYFILHAFKCMFIQKVILQKQQFNMVQLHEKKVFSKTLFICTRWLGFEFLT